MPPWWLPTSIYGLLALNYWGVSTPERMGRELRRWRYIPDRGYFAALWFSIGFTPAFAVSLFIDVTGTTLGTVIGIWVLVFALYGFVGLAFHVPIPKWFVPPAYKNKTEHVYPRPVIGLRRVDRLSDRPDAVALDLDS